MTEIAIQVENLSKLYIIGSGQSQSIRQLAANNFQRIFKNFNADKVENFWALKDVNFNVLKGEAVGIIGRNGAGKSTLLKVLSRITQPTKGRVILDGKISSLLEVGTGFHPELSGRENIFLNGSILGMKRKEIKNKFDQIVSFSGIDKFIDTPVKRYSSGMYVRLAFAVAAHLDSEILIIDEVLAVGDAEFQKKCLGKMGDLANKEGRTVLFVSHDMNAISTLTDKCLYLKQGMASSFKKTHEAMNDYFLDYNKSDLIYIKSIEDYSKAYVSKVELVTSKPQNVHVNGSKFEVLIHIKNSVHLRNGGISFQVLNTKNIPVVHTWLFNSENPLFDFTTDELVLKCSIDTFRLYMGKYNCTIVLASYSGREVIEVIENICPFEVVMHEKKRDYEWQPNTCTYLEDFNWVRL